MNRNRLTEMLMNYLQIGRSKAWYVAGKIIEDSKGKLVEE